ncbi:hypothetical protein ACKP2L_07120 [Oenococcus alcoholitolerans]|uniref:GGDEF domain-containing protein n=1 Tax=Oenococcus alcoholitolerans TaxID=931074 RepID=A0ABR4XR84_9LACO|nr:hypothetical protein Q757_03760 [Oenococcus alcoholitolerans]
MFTKIRKISLESSILFIIFMAIAVLVWSNSFLPQYLETIALLIAISILLGMFLPTILISWVVIIIVSTGIVILTAGSVFLTVPERIFLIAIFPFFAFLTQLVHENILLRRESLRVMKHIKSFSNHVDTVTNFRRSRLAKKFYGNCIRFLRNNPNIKIVYRVALINLAHQEQFFQLNNREYFRIIASAANVLKKIRMPSEHIFYLDDRSFLLIFPATTFKDYDQINAKTEQELNKIRFRSVNSVYEVQFMLETITVNAKNVDKYTDLKQVLHRLHRKLETHIIKEYQ